MTSSDRLEEFNPIVLSVFRSCFPDQDVSLDDDFFDLGGDSLKAQELCLLLECKLSKEVHPSILFEVSSPKEIAEFFESTHSF